MSTTTDDGLQIQIDDLRERLKRRNHLLDIVRKAYHRDVYVIRDCWSRIKNGESIESVQDLTSNLTSVPSIDLREVPGFFLFSPHECELKMNPCYYCGGRLEVVHRESSRIKTLEENLNGSKASSIYLSQKVDEYVTTINKLHHTETILNNRLLEMKHNLLLERYRYNQLLSECIEHRNNARKITQLMEENKGLKYSLDDCASRIQIILDRDNELTKELACNKSTLEALNIQNEQSRRICSQMEMALSFERSEIVQLKNNIMTIENERLALTCRFDMQQEELVNFQRQALDLNTMVKKLEREKETLRISYHDTKQTLNQTIAELRQELAESSTAQESLQNDYKLYQSEKEKEVYCMKNTVHYHRNMTASFIRLLYDRCLVFGKVLKENKRDGMTVNKDQSDNAFFQLCDCLDKNLDSERLDWNKLLDEDSDRRQIFGNMSNRLVSDSNQLMDLLQMHQVKRRTDLEKLQRTSELNMKRRLGEFHDQVSSLENRVKHKDEELLLRDSLWHMALADADSSRDEMRWLNVQLLSTRKTLNDANIRITDGNTRMKQLEKELEMEKEKKMDLELQVKDLQLQLVSQQTSLDQLEKLLGKTSTRLAQLIAKDKERLDTNVSLGVNASPSMADFTQQADFFAKDITQLKHLFKK